MHSPEVGTRAVLANRWAASRVSGDRCCPSRLRRRYAVIGVLAAADRLQCRKSMAGFAVERVVAMPGASKMPIHKWRPLTGVLALEGYAARRRGADRGLRRVCPQTWPRPNVWVARWLSALRPQGSAQRVGRVVVVGVVDRVMPSGSSRSITRNVVGGSSSATSTPRRSSRRAARRSTAVWLD
jgi:hypothetical protein